MDVSYEEVDGNIGIEAAWVGSIAGTVGEIGGDNFTGYQSFWVGSKKKYKFDNGEGDLTFGSDKFTFNV